MLVDYATKKAREELWRDPYHDLQTIIRPARLTPPRGSATSIRVLWEEVDLPDYDFPHLRYHVYQIGSVKPQFLGLLGLDESWRTLYDLINDTNLIAEVYLEDGRVLPRFDCYLRWGRHRNLLLAVRERKISRELREQRIELRLYTNSYFISSYADDDAKTLIEARVYEGKDDFSKFRNRYRDYRDNKPGTALAYRNGELVYDFWDSSLEKEDIVEYVYDGSVRDRIELKISELNTFYSELDERTKYLIHNKEKSTEDPTIDYADDIDIYIIEENENGYHGIYYHRGRRDALRMLTHSDYSLPSDRLEALHELNSDRFGELNEMRLLVLVRNSGLERKLPYESSRLFELYRLPEDAIPRAMLGVHSGLKLWQASELERSDTMVLLRERDNDLDSDLVEKAYGYNGLAKMLGDTPESTYQHGQWPTVDVPPAYQYRACAYEYDKDGLLLGYYPIEADTRYPCRNSKTKLVEFVSGHPTREPTVTFGETKVDVDPRYNHRVYIATLSGDSVLEDTWRDISNSELVDAGDDKIKLDIDTDHHYPAIASDYDFIGYSFQTSPMNGVITFEITVDETHGGDKYRRGASIPTRRLDLWLNGRFLIEGVDYILDWPRVVITNHRYHENRGEEHDIVVRAHGLIDESFEMSSSIESGFVEDGYIGKLRRYMIREDMVQTIVVGGSVLRSSQIELGALDEGIRVPDFDNGLPYALFENVVPLRDQYRLETYPMRDEAREQDEQIREYFSKYYGDDIVHDSYTIPDYYTIYSPFIARVASLLSNHYVDDETLIRTYALEDMKDLFEDHTWLLDFDPAYLERVDTEFMAVRAHPYDDPIVLDYPQYRFLRTLIDYLYDVRISLAELIQIQPPNEEHS